MAGASGFLGTAWRDHLARQGHEVVRLVRGRAMSDQESAWDPMDGKVDQAVIESADVVTCLSGAPLAHVPWTASYKKTFLDSRTRTTATLADAIAMSERKPAFVAQSGIAGYVDQGDAVVTEADPLDAPTFMGGVTREWEAATESASEAGARVAIMRTGVVLDKRGGALKPLLLAFRAGLGGKVGSGRQYFSTISLPDWLHAATWLAENEHARGAYNLVGPNQTTNAEFTTVLGRMVRRPTFLPVPAPAVRLALGSASTELLGGAKVEPARLLDEGFTFRHPTLESRLAAALHR